MGLYTRNYRIQPKLVFYGVANLQQLVQRFWRLGYLGD
nr:MAG TPA: hypothetical protein [Caudoviricetes sp.]